MWRSSSLLLKQSLTSTRHLLNSRCLNPCLPRAVAVTPFLSYSSSVTGGKGESEDGGMSYAEAKRLMRLVNLDDLKRKLGTQGDEVIRYSELLEACERSGVAKSVDEAVAFARVLDEAGVVLLHRDKVHLHPDRVVDLVRSAVPLALSEEDDPRIEELKQLHQKMEEIDMLAHKQVRRILYTYLGLSVMQVGLFFRLTFWEFSWDVMEPIAFFTTAASLVFGYGYFLATARDPSYQDLMKRLFLSKQKKLIKRHNFDVKRYLELKNKCRLPLDAPAYVKRIGLELEPEDFLDHH